MNSNLLCCWVLIRESYRVEDAVGADAANFVLAQESDRLYTLWERGQCKKYTRRLSPQAAVFFWGGWALLRGDKLAIWLAIRSINYRNFNDSFREIFFAKVGKNFAKIIDLAKFPRSFDKILCFAKCTICYFAATLPWPCRLELCYAVHANPRSGGTPGNCFVLCVAFHIEFWYAACSARSAWAHRK